MSERGTFITNYIYCNECLEAIKPILLGHEKYLCSQLITSWDSNPYLPIIAGKTGGLYAGEEADTFEMEFIPEIAKVICHTIRIAMLCEDEKYDKIFYIEPLKEELNE